MIFIDQHGILKACAMQGISFACLNHTSSDKKIGDIHMKMFAIRTKEPKLSMELFDIIDRYKKVGVEQEQPVENQE